MQLPPFLEIIKSGNYSYSSSIFSKDKYAHFNLLTPWYYFIKSMNNLEWDYATFNMNLAKINASEHS